MYICLVVWVMPCSTGPIHWNALWTDGIAKTCMILNRHGFRIHRNAARAGGLRGEYVKHASRNFFCADKRNCRDLRSTPPSAALKKRLCGVFSLFAACFKGSTLLFTNFCEKSSQKFRDLEGAALCARPFKAHHHRSRAHSPVETLTRK